MRFSYLLLAALLALPATAQEVLIQRPQAAAAPSEPARWRPTRSLSFDVQLNDPSRSTLVPSVQAAELDIDIDQKILNEVRGRGIKTICYFNAGAWESYRSDMNKFPKAVLGSFYDGYPDERWLDIRNITALAPIMRARMDQCKKKGFVAIDPDNVNGYENKTGFPLTLTHQKNYNLWLMKEAHARGLSIALKNTPDLAGVLEKAGFDFAVTESCFAEGSCRKYSYYVNANKPVLALEYVDEGMTLSKFCSQAKALRMNAILKRSSSSIDYYRKPCP